MNSRVLIVAVAALLLAEALHAWAANVNSGEWEVTSVAGTDQAAPTPNDTFRVCLSADAPVPMAREDQGICKIDDVQTRSNTVTWKAACHDPVEGTRAEGSGSITYDGDTFQGTLETSTRIPGEPKMDLSIRLKGRRVGPCKD
jgi:hypothetical protein